MKIISVDKNSIADELGIVAGDELVAFDGNKVVDVLDLEFYSNAEKFVMTIKSNDEVVDYDIEKYDYEELGISVEREIAVRSCKNNCIFCFVDQLPNKDLRKTLYVKDDDYRHSFISGNYVTLTNCSKSDIDRIIRLRLSPIYVSVHTTDYALRNKMLGISANAPDIVSQLQTLKNAGISVHAQIVYCPTVNDDYVNSCKVLSKLCSSLAIVPVGLTDNCNSELKAVDKVTAKKVIDDVTALQTEFLAELGTRFVFLADEFYLKANVSLPDYSSYESFPQIENGVGLLSTFLREFDEAIIEAKQLKRVTVPSCAVITSVSAYPLISSCVNRIQDELGGKIDVKSINNDFFGKQVTVAGLVVASDVINQLKGKKYDRLVIPRVMLKEFGDVFLDNLTIQDLARALNTQVRVAEVSGEGLITALTEEKL